MVSELEIHTTFDQAIDTVLESLALSARVHRHSRRRPSLQRWCDRYENKDKRSGAFSSGSYGFPRTPHELQGRRLLGHLHPRS